MSIAYITEILKKTSMQSGAFPWSPVVDDFFLLSDPTFEYLATSGSE